MVLNNGFSLCLALHLVITVTRALVCQDPGQHTHSDRVVENNFELSSTISFTCHTGYHLKDGGDTYVILCEDEGGSSARWNGTAPSCIPVICVNPPTVLHALVSGYSFGYGERITYKCEDGYQTMDGKMSMISTCSETGDWFPPPLACVAEHCEQPEIVHHTTRAGDVFTFGKTITYTCDEGYHVVRGNRILTCGPEGSWKGQYPQCDRIDCGDPGMLDNSGRSMTGTGYLSAVTYTCKQGFYMDPTAGPLSRVCGLSSKWSNTAPVCLGVFCDEPGVVSHANRTSSLGELTFRYPEEITYQCHTGYVPDFELGSTAVACQMNREWDMNPTKCTMVRCKDTTKARNVELVNDTHVYDTVRTYTCIEGHELATGFLERTCLANASYDADAPQCDRVDCGMPKATDHSSRTFDNGTRYKDIIVYTCNPGYEVEGADGQTKLSLLCQEDKQWSHEIPVCIRASCGAASQGEGSAVLNPAEHYFGDSAQSNCLVGHEWLSGNESRHCQLDKTWTGDAYNCERVNCGDPGVPEHATTQGDMFLYGDRVIFECVPGYEISDGDSEMVCSATEVWNGTLPTCSRISCGLPGAVQDAAHEGENFLFEDVVTYMCNHGYEWKSDSGSTNRTCEETTFWSKSPVCDRISCGDPGESNGTMKLGSGHQFEDVVNYTCGVGHGKVGQQWGSINCSAERQWTGERITCKAVVCPDPGEGENATRSGDSFVYDSVVTYACIEGHRLPDGIDSIVCLSTKNWSHPVPACSIVPGFVLPPKVMAVVEVVDAKGSDTIGMIGLGLVLFEVFVLTLIDIPKLWKDLSMMRSNLAPLYAIMALHWAAFRARMKRDPVKSLMSLRNDSAKEKKKKKKKKRRKTKKETTYEVMEEKDGQPKTRKKRGVIRSDD